MGRLRVCIGTCDIKAPMATFDVRAPKAPSRKGIKVWTNAAWGCGLKRKLDVHKKFPATDIFRKYQDTPATVHCKLHKSLCVFCSRNGHAALHCTS